MSTEREPTHEVRWEPSDDRHAYEKLPRLLFDPPKRQDRSHQ